MKNTQDFTFPGWMFEYFLDSLSWDRVLDIGCAYGRDLRKMIQRWLHVSWIEISENLRDLAHTSVKEHIHLWDMTTLHKLYSPWEFDWIFCAASLLHLDVKIQKQLLRNIFTLLKKNWIFFLEVKISEDSTKTIYKESVSLPWVRKKYVILSESDCFDMLHDIWFKVIKEHTNSYKWNTWKIIIAKK